jgi:hypothetical protein
VRQAALVARPTVQLTALLLAQWTAQLTGQPMVRPSATFVGAANSAVGSAADGTVG